MTDGMPGMTTQKTRASQHQAAVKLEAKTCKWIEEVTGDSQGDRTIAQWLGDGTLLCKIANKVHPDLIHFIETDFAGLTPQMYEHRRRMNISNFTRALKRLTNTKLTAYPDWIFSPLDLTESQNILKVIKCLDTLEKAYPIEVLNDSARKEELAPADEDDMNRVASMATTSSAVPTEALESIGTRMTKRRSEAADNVEIHACAWVEAVTGSSRNGKPASEWLGDGVLLCQLANILRPGSIEVIETELGNTEASRNARKRVNITNFVKALKDPQGFALDQSAVFDPINLQRGMKMEKVFSCLDTLSKKYPAAARIVEEPPVASVRSQAEEPPVASVRSQAEEPPVASVRLQAPAANPVHTNPPTPTHAAEAGRCTKCSIQ